ncbi:MAG: MMPL family transporter [Planctomycetia bacterium]|nr:MMPL family transporter [Planctomycetia bacterium]
MKKDFFKDYSFRIVAVVVFLLAFVWMGTKQTILSNSNSVEDWLPAQYQQTRDYRWYLKLFPFESYVVVSWDGCELDDDRIELFAQKLVPEQTIDNFSLVPPSAGFKADLQLDQAPDQAAEELKDAVGSAPNASTQALLDASGADLPENATTEHNAPSYFKSVMTGPRLVRLLSQAYEKIERKPQISSGATRDDQDNAELDQKIREKLKGTLIGPDGKSTAMIITLNNGARDGKSLQKVLNRIRELSVESGLPDVSKIQTGSFAAQMVKSFNEMVDEIAHGRKVRMDGVILGGPPVDNVALDQEGERTLYRLAGVCAVIGVVIAFICLRSIRLTLFVFWIAALSAGVALAIVSLTGGTCDSILLSMPALVYVLGMSGAVHLINYYHDAIREHGLNGATERAVLHAFTPCFFAQLTTALGLGSLFMGRLVPITKFGVYSAVGVLCTLLLLFLYLPALLYFNPSKKFAELHGGKGLELGKGRLERFWDFFGGLIIRRHNVVLVLCFAMMIFFGYYLPKIKTSVKMMSFFSPDADIVQNYTWLEDKLGPLVPLELVICFDNDKLYNESFRTVERLELINELSEKLKSTLSEDVGGTLSVALFTPDLSEVTSKGSGAYRAVSAIVGKTVDDSREALRDYLAIEGNPTLEELLAFLQERLDQENASYQQDVEAFLTEVHSVDALNDLTLEDLDNVDENNLDENLAPYYAKYQSLMRVESDVEELHAQTDALREHSDYLKEQKIEDLTSLLSVFHSDRALRRISQEQAALLREGAERWQRERGVEVWRISIRVWSLKKDIDYSAFIENVQNVVEPTLAEASIRLQTTLKNANVSQPAEIEELIQEELQKSRDFVAQSLTEQTKAGHNAQDEMLLFYNYTLKDLSEQERVELQNSMGPDHTSDLIYPAGFSAKYTGMVPLVYQTQHELINGLTASLVMAFVLILIVFIFLLRSIPAGFISMLPNIFPVVVVFGFMSWAGILVDVGTMMTASVALGVAVDDTMHYLTWFSDGLGQGMTPQEAARNAYRRCATAMTQSSLIAGLGLFSFAFSTFVPTQRFGIMMLAILMTAEFGDLIFLPALLTCKPFGRFFEHRRMAIKVKRQAPDVSAEEQTA